MSKFAEARKEDAATRALNVALDQLMPFFYFYQQAGEGLPDFCFREKEEIPYPYRSLLVHENDMTPTLAAFHQSRLGIKVHAHEDTEGMVMRMVSLTKEDGAAVEFGAIAIQLDMFPSAFCERVREGKQPLGGILGEFEIEHRGGPLCYFSVPADKLIGEALDQPEGEELYGRCNQLMDRDGMVFADIVEILPRSSSTEEFVRP